MRAAFLCLVCGVGLAACTEQTILSYQNRPAQTPEECRAAYDEARQRGSNTPVNYSSNASVMGASLGKGIAKGMIESAYQQCLARVGATAAPIGAEGARARLDAEIQAQQAPPVRRNSTYGACPPRVSVMYGGSAYCVGDAYR